MTEAATCPGAGLDAASTEASPGSRAVAEPMDPAVAGSPVEALLGSRVAELPPVVRRVHATVEDVAGHGTFHLEPARSRLGSRVARLLGLPGAAGEVPATLVIHRVAPSAGAEANERWSRSFGGEALRSTLSAEGERLVERVGRIDLLYDLDVADGQLRFHQVRARLRLGPSRLPLRVPVPRRLAPRVTASVGATAQGDQLDVEVRIRGPVLGTLLAYTGHLTPWPREAEPPAEVRRRGRLDESEAS